MTAWTPDQDDLLRALYGREPAKKIAEQLNRSFGSVTSRAYGLGLAGITAKSLWTEEEDLILRTWYPKETCPEVAKRLPNRNPNSISKRLGLLGIRSWRVGGSKPWTAKEDARLEWEWGVFKIETLAKHFERTPAALKQRAKILDLGSPRRGKESLRALAIRSGYSRKKLVNAMKRLNMVVPRAVTAVPSRGTKHRPTALTFEQSERVLDFLLSRPDGANVTQSPTGEWGGKNKPDACLDCQSAENPHCALGRCRLCWQRQRTSKKKTALPPGQISL